MMVYSKLTEAVFRLELTSSTVGGAAEELFDALALEVGADDRGALGAELMDRVRLGTVSGDGEFVLLPTVTSRVKRLGIALGRSPSGLVAEGAETPTVHFICLVLVPPGQRAAGFQLLNRLAVLLREPMVRTQLLWAETEDEVLSVCREAEGLRPLPLAAWLKDRVAAALWPSAAPGGERA